MCKSGCPGLKRQGASQGSSAVWRRPAQPQAPGEHRETFPPPPLTASEQGGVREHRKASLAFPENRLQKVHIQTLRKPQARRQLPSSHGSALCPSSIPTSVLAHPGCWGALDSNGSPPLLRGKTRKWREEALALGWDPPGLSSPASFEPSQGVPVWPHSYSFCCAEQVKLRGWVTCKFPFSRGPIKGHTDREGCLPARVGVPSQVRAAGPCPACKIALPPQPEGYCLPETSASFKCKYATEAAHVRTCAHLHLLWISAFRSPSWTQD